MNQTNMKSVVDEDVSVVCSTQRQFTFKPLGVQLKRDVCEELNVPYMENLDCVYLNQQKLTNPNTEREIAGDGNCFFRAISFSLSNSEDYHHVVRNAVCKHMNQNK